jgi:hypothetical protein
MPYEIQLTQFATLHVNTGEKLIIVDRDTIDDDAGALVPVWTQVEHVINLVPSRSEQTQDTSDYDDAGEDSSLVSGRGKTFAVGHNFYADPADQSRPLGQLTVENLADNIGATSLGQFMYRPYPDADVEIFNAHVTGLSGPGGAAKEIGKVNYTLTKSGQFYKGPEPEAGP